MKKNKKMFLALLSLAITIICFVFVVFAERFLSDLIKDEGRVRLSEPKHSIEEIGDGFNLLWEMPEINATIPSNRNNLTAFSNKVYLITKGLDENDPTVLSLIAVDAYTGQLEWLENAKFKKDMTHNRQYLFVKNGGGISAYDPDSGKQVWYTKPLGTRGIDHMVVTDVELFLTTTPDNTYILDSTTGAIKDSSVSSSIATSLFLVENEKVYWQQWPLYLVSSDAYTGDVIWKHSFEGGFEQTPVFVDDMVFVTSSWGQLFAIDKGSGETIWSTENPQSLTDSNRVISNIAVDNNILYYLTQDAHIQAVNVLNGVLIDQVKFTPDCNQLEMTLGSYRFDITANNGIVAVYFGDSFQVFAFQFQKDN